MIDRLTVKYHDEEVGVLSLTPDNRLVRLNTVKAGCRTASVFPRLNCLSSPVCS